MDMYIGLSFIINHVRFLLFLFTMFLNLAICDVPIIIYSFQFCNFNLQRSVYYLHVFI